MKNKVKERRKELGLTQVQLSRSSKVSRPIISNLENQCIDNVGSKIMTKIAQALQSKESDIFFTQTVKNTEQKER